MTDTTRNSGAGQASASSTAFYISSNTVLDAGDGRLSAARAVAPLAGGESSAGSTTVTLPALPSGTWYLLARADDEGTVAELQAGTTAVPLPPATAGTFYLLVVLDADGAVPEYNEAYNTAARSVRIQ